LPIARKLLIIGFLLVAPKPTNRMKRSIARVISTLGNPLVLSFLVAIYVNFSTLEWAQALERTAILAGCGIVPIFWYINRKVGQGNYADHDVSARTKRPTLYLFSLSVLLVMIAILHFTGQPRAVVNGAWAAWTLAAVSFLINFKAKTSLHTGYAFLIGFLALSAHFGVGVGLIAFAFLVGWSRVALRRHTLLEVFIGATLGSSIGAVFYGFVKSQGF
jgi:hypothetical protein